MAAGLKRDVCLDIIGMTRNQFYYDLKGTKPGKGQSTTTIWRDPKTLNKYEVDNAEVVNKIVAIKLDPDQSDWYRLITISLKIVGYYINHKKVYRLMEQNMLLEDKRHRIGRRFVKYRRVTPTGPLKVLEMDIKYFWIHEKRRYAFVLTIIDTFTRYALTYSSGYSMKAIHVKQAWEYVVAEYLQPTGLSSNDIELDLIIRSDNGKQFTSAVMATFFKENNIRHEFIRPYTPEENGHVESFHGILGKALSDEWFSSLISLEERLDIFYRNYNNHRSHSGTKGIPPAKFWALYDLGMIEVLYLSNRAQKFKLKIAYQDIITLPDIGKYEYRVIRA